MPKAFGSVRELESFRRRILSPMQGLVAPGYCRRMVGGSMMHCKECGLKLGENPIWCVRCHDKYMNKYYKEHGI
jgi:hypothetical protein